MRALQIAALALLAGPVAAQCIGASTATWPRKQSARARLHIEWHSPKLETPRTRTGERPQPDPQRDQKPKSERELPVEKALAELRGQDPRPLLIFRDHRGIEDTKLASLIDRLLESERFRLASKWFRCVRLPQSASEPGHPFAKLFAETKAPHLLLISASGKKHVKLLSSAKAKASWSIVASVLREDYQRDPSARIREYQLLLNQFDACDSRITELEERIAGLRDRAITDKVDAGKVRRLEARLADAYRQHEKLEKLECKVADLGLDDGESSGLVPGRRRRHDRRSQR